MIPKIVHYCWFGQTEKPQIVNTYIKTWKNKLDGYEFIEWNEENFDISICLYTKEAWYLKKWAFVSDVARLYALYEYGGIYLDTDVEVIKSFDPFLSEISFLGYETENLVGTGIIGARPKALWIKQMLEDYYKRSFINWDGTINNTANTKYVTKLIQEIPIQLRPSLYPIDFFCACNWRNLIIETTENTVSIHHYSSTWKKDRFCFIEKVENFLAYRLRIPNAHFYMRVKKLIIDYLRE